MLLLVLLLGTCGLGMDEGLTPPSFFSCFSLFRLMTGTSSLSLCRAGKQFIYLIPDESDLNQFFLSAALKSPASCAHVTP